MRRTAVINVVGLTEACLGPAMPRLRQFLERARSSTIIPSLPAVTCTAQANYMTGQLPSRHGIVGNGWYDRELAEVHFWKQSNHLVHAPKIWEIIRQLDPAFTCAKLFWWHNMYSSADYSITPRPIYRADGGKIFDLYSWPYSIRPEIKRDLGEFPFPCFWGPAAGVDSPLGKADAASQWIAQAAQWIEERFEPGLNLIYLPHLDYNFQRHGPRHPQAGRDLGEIDALVGQLIDFFRARAVQVIILSEYGLTPVRRPIYLNRLFREKNWLAIKEEMGRETLDCGASKVFAVADHQVAHVYARDSSLAKTARELIEKQPGIAGVLAGPDRGGLEHPRAGDLVVLAEEDAWFSYYFWLEDRLAPDYARTVDIHRKPGYDPVELFLDPQQPFVKSKIIWRRAQKKLGFRMLMDVIPLDAALVKGSHGIRPASRTDFPLFISERSVEAELLPEEVCGAIKQLIMD